MSHFGGSQLASLKPNLVDRKPSPSSSSLRLPTPSPSSVRTATLSPSSLRSHSPGSSSVWEVARPPHTAGHLALYKEVGCTTDTHPVNPTFMEILSAFIFDGDGGDLSLLWQAKRRQLMQEGVPAITDLLVDRSIGKKELSLYCCRRTRNEEATIHPIEKLLQELGGQTGETLWVCHCWMRCTWSTSGVCRNGMSGAFRTFQECRSTLKSAPPQRRGSS
ncbi:uncharacterized protein LOC130407523 [Triplophysa dalaica]|uniref:uncharacterized protein LOC130407523 n=1 Tax=Triplophysa dalaica TaxID=1582913 RepID=UPI0024DFCEBF|nr:uncharacterized protein LOC130407523 [Triplophysa dalaica]